MPSRLRNLIGWFARCVRVRVSMSTRVIVSERASAVRMSMSTLKIQNVAAKEGELRVSEGPRRN